MKNKNNDKYMSIYTEHKDKLIKACEKHGLDLDELMKPSPKAWGGRRPSLLIGKEITPVDPKNTFICDGETKALYLFKLIDDEVLLIYRNDDVEFFDHTDKYDDSLDWYTKKKNKNKNKNKKK